MGERGNKEFFIYYLLLIMEQVIFINGGTSKENFKDYYDFLEKISFDPYEIPFKNWNKTFGEYL